MKLKNSEVGGEGGDATSCSDHWVIHYKTKTELQTETFLETKKNKNHPKENS